MAPASPLARSATTIMCFGVVGREVFIDRFQLTCAHLTVVGQHVRAIDLDPTRHTQRSRSLRHEPSLTQVREHPIDIRRLWNDPVVRVLDVEREFGCIDGGSDPRRSSLPHRQDQCICRGSHLPRAFTVSQSCNPAISLRFGCDQRSPRPSQGARVRVKLRRYRLAYEDIGGSGSWIPCLSQWTRQFHLLFPPIELEAVPPSRYDFAC